MRRRLRHRFRLRLRLRRRPAAVDDERDRSSGEDVVAGRQELADDATAPGTPRLKTRNL